MLIVFLSLSLSPTSCQFFDTNARLRKICSNELNPYKSKSGKALSQKLRKGRWKKGKKPKKATGEQSLANPSDNAACRVVEVDAVHWQESISAKSQPGESDHMRIEETAAKPVGNKKAKDDAFTVRTKTNKVAQQSIDGSEPHDDRAKIDRIDELKTAFRKVDKILKRLESCLQDFVGTCELMRTPPNDRDQKA